MQYAFKITSIFSLTCFVNNEAMNCKFCKPKNRANTCGASTINRIKEPKAFPFKFDFLEIFSNVMQRHDPEKLGHAYDKLDIFMYALMLKRQWLIKLQVHRYLGLNFFNYFHCKKNIKKT